MDVSRTDTDTRAAMLARFADLGIPPAIVPYPAHTTVEEGKRLRGDMAGTFTKNLLLKDKKGRLFLVAFHEDHDLDLRTLHTRIGANGRLGFAPAERMSELLGVSPGWLTPLGIVSDVDGQVTIVLDASLLAAAQVNFHPLVQEESIGLSPAHLLAFIRSYDREPIVVDLEPTVQNARTAADTG